MQMKLGFIGTGNITAALVEGFCTLPDYPYNIIVSPRNAEKAKCLATRFESVQVAGDNQAVIDGSEIVFLALRPQIAEPVLRQLSFRENKTIVSLIGAISVARIREMVAPVRTLFRAVPLPPAAQHVGPIILYPGDPAVGALLGQIGELYTVLEENHISVLAAVTALMSPFFALLGETARWAEAAGVDRPIAHNYTASMFHALAYQALKMPETNFSDLAAEVATPGGLNEQALAVIREQSGYTAFLKALDAVAVRLGVKPPLHSQQSR
jgi:pyrroline-5-carboxylate reductase